MVHFTEAWVRWCWHAGRAAHEKLLAAEAPDARDLEALWLAEMKRALDRYMRSPAFLGWMRLGVMLAARTKKVRR